MEYSYSYSLMCPSIGKITRALSNEKSTFMKTKIATVTHADKIMEVDLF